MKKKQDELNKGLVKGLRVLSEKRDEQSQAINYLVVEMERQSKGTSRANTELVKLSDELNAEIANLSMELEAISATIAGGSVNDSVSEQLDNLNSRSTALYMQVADYGERIIRIENSPAINYDLEKSKIKVAHKSEIDTVTPWAQAFAWGGVGAICGLLLFGVMANVENAWIGVLSFGLIGLFVSAFVLTKLNLRLQIEAQHDWAKKQPPVVVVNEDIEEPTSQWWASDQANKA
ncbi:MAG: hypothetical protein WCP56_00680 [Candidatus Saccharibacteria bacterium]